MKENTIQDTARKFIKKYCTILGSGISFDKDAGTFVGSLYINPTYKMRDLDWWGGIKDFMLYIEMGVAVEVVDGKITNRLTESLFLQLLSDGLTEMRSFSSFSGEYFDLLLSQLGITEAECLTILQDLYFTKATSLLNKSFPVAQRAYDRWVEKGGALQAKKERVASTFGKDFLDDLTKGLGNFQKTYIQQQTSSNYALLKMQYSKCPLKPYTDEQLKERARKEAEESWPFWISSEIYRITDVLLKYDVGVCSHYELKYDMSSMQVEGKIWGKPGAYLYFHTIFAGGYNIQCLHTRTLAKIVVD